MQGPKPFHVSQENMVSNPMDEKVAKAVQQFPVLNNKTMRDFKDRNKKNNAWVEVARQAGLPTRILSQKRKSSFSL